MQATTTVFVTVYPTSPVPVDTNPSTQNAGSDGTLYRTVYPTKTVQVSPLNSVEDGHQTVQAFTTLTISDLWISESSAVDSPTSADLSSVSAAAATGVSPPDGSPSRGPIDYSTVPNASGAKAGETNGPSYSGSSSQAQGTANPSSAGTQYITVTDTDVEWVSGNGGPSPVTILSEHTVTLASAEAEATDGRQAAVTCWTVTGSDGKETVVESVISTIRATEAVPVSTIAAISPDGTFFPQAVTSAVQDQAPVTTITVVGPTPAYTGPGMTTTTAINVLGPDGISSTVYSTWVIPGASVADASGVMPDATSVPPASTQRPWNGDDVASRTSYTILGSDGKPTVVESILIIPASVILATDLPQNLPNGISIQATPLPASQTLVAGSDRPGVVTTCSSYTLLGSDGRLTVIETTYLIQASIVSPTAQATPSGLVTGIPAQATVAPGQALPGAMTAQGLTTCVSYTVLGADGIPTIIESTIALPSSNALPTNTVIGLPSMVPQVETSMLPQGTQVSSAGIPCTTVVTVDVLGRDGLATPVVETIILPPPTAGQQSATAPSTTIGLPSLVPQAVSDLPQGITPSVSGPSPITTAVTVTVLGPNGTPTPIVETIVVTPQAQAPVSGLAPSLPASGVALSTSAPSLKEYGSVTSQGQVIISPPFAATSATDFLPAGTNAATNAPIFTIVTGPGGIPVFSQAAAGGYGWLPAGASPAAYAALLSDPSVVQPQQAPTTAVQTSTWVNVIPEPTTTYTMKFPLTTLATVFVPARISAAKRGLRRQDSHAPFAGGWSNVTSKVTQPVSDDGPLAPSTQASPASPAALTSTSLDANQGVSPVVSAPEICPEGTKVGNITINFDSSTPGPLFNPDGDFWFSQGFLVAPLSPQSVQGYKASSGGQLVEFVPPALSSPSTSGSSDSAEIGVGPNSSKPCFRFNFYGANLGCAAQAAEQWCEFEVSAYTYNTAAANEMSIAWSEVKRVAACPSFPGAPCALTPVTFDGYQNLTSILIRLHVGGNLRTWWADDFQLGWTDNSCEVAQCRQGVAPQRAKREVVESAVRDGVWHWTRSGLKRMQDRYVWNSAK
ncbi:uncharacterized protein UV8b_07762 [Ustilaginoidea virens]|uniref:DUF7371 domain-containing protein n=1 Tax=Ustilaginoidea virens TaxID=1159556 RepID=A0A8E5MKW9_USTVR|nr:uncharacterized protein UV8b_07762 [Ustilaginoidea virens]QUC23521.1 hypothetical protein UV8b_07762 [Ustilaginoidea virens]